jgi:hypothetical protein
MNSAAGDTEGHGISPTGIPIENIAVGKCFVTEIGQVRRVLEIKDGTVKYESRGKTAHGGSWGDVATVADGKFARDGNPRVPCDSIPDADRMIPIDQLNASNDE